jgi:hypothetical protein
MKNNNAFKELLKSNSVAAWLDKRAKQAPKEAGIDEKKTAPEPNKNEVACAAKDKDEKKETPRFEPDPFARQLAVIDMVRYIQLLKQLGAD